MKWYMLAILLPIAACDQLQPQDTPHGAVMDSNGQYHYADDYTYRQAQTSLDEFCYTPLVDINRILRDESQRHAKEVICKKDSANIQKTAKKMAEEGKSSDEVEQEQQQHEPNSGGSYVATKPIIPSEGGSNVYIDVNHGHPQ